MKKFWKKWPLQLVAVFAFVASISSANACCQFLLHQPELPNEVKKLRRF